MQYITDNNINHLNINIMQTTNFNFDEMLKNQIDITNANFSFRDFLNNLLESTENEDRFDPDFFKIHSNLIYCSNDGSKTEILIITPNNVPDKENQTEFDKYWNLYDEMLEDIHKEFLSCLNLRDEGLTVIKNTFNTTAVKPTFAISITFADCSLHISATYYEY